MRKSKRIVGALFFLFTVTFYAYKGRDEDNEMR